MAIFFHFYITFTLKDVLIYRTDFFLNQSLYIKNASIPCRSLKAGIVGQIPPNMGFFQT